MLKITNLIIKHISKMINANRSPVRHDLTKDSIILSPYRISLLESIRTPKTSILGVYKYADPAKPSNEMLITDSEQAIRHAVNQ